MLTIIENILLNYFSSQKVIFNKTFNQYTLIVYILKIF